MELSYKTKRLLLMCVAIVILVLAATEGTKDISTPNSRLRDTTPTAFVPPEIDPKIFETMKMPVEFLKPTPTPTTPPKPTISAEAYLVANLDTGELYSQLNPTRVFPIASISKLVTAIVAQKHMSPGQQIVITQSMLDAYGEAGQLKLGESFTLGELLYPLLLESSNDAAEAIAQTYGYENFIKEMNAFVASLGMTSTAFRDASGLNSGNVSNAHDLLLLARYMYQYQKTLLELTRQTVYSVPQTSEHEAHIWKTINPFPYDPHFFGGKTGRTTLAKESMMSFFRYTANGMTYPVAIIVLRSDFSVREIDSSLLFSRFIQRIGVTP